METPVIAATRPITIIDGLSATGATIEALRQEVHILIDQASNSQTIAQCCLDLHEMDDETIHNLAFLLGAIYDTVKDNQAWLWAHPLLNQSIREILDECQAEFEETDP